MAPYARAALEEVGVYIEGHRARQVDANMLEEADLVSAMAPEYAATLPRHFPESLEKIHTLPGYAYGVPDREVITDPYGLLMSDYRGSVRRSFECVNLPSVGSLAKAGSSWFGSISRLSSRTEAVSPSCRQRSRGLIRSAG
jgi:hypothetical protein